MSTPKRLVGMLGVKTVLGIRVAWYNVSLIKAYCSARHVASGRVRRKTFQFAPIAHKLESLYYRVARWTFGESTYY